MLLGANTGERSRRPQGASQSLIIYCSYNEYTGVRLTGVPAPVPEPRSALAPNFPAWQHALEGICRLYKAFRGYSKNF